MLYRLARTGFFQLDAEKAHDLAIKNFQRFNGTLLFLSFLTLILLSPTNSVFIFSSVSLFSPCVCVCVWAYHCI